MAMPFFDRKHRFPLESRSDLTLFWPLLRICRASVSVVCMRSEAPVGVVEPFVLLSNDLTPCYFSVSKLHWLIFLHTLLWNLTTTTIYAAVGPNCCENSPALVSPSSPPLLHHFQVKVGLSLPTSFTPLHFTWEDSREMHDAYEMRQHLFYFFYYRWNGLSHIRM